MGLALGFRSVVVRISTLDSLWLGVKVVRGDLREALVTKCLIRSCPGLSHARCTVGNTEYGFWGKPPFFPLNVPFNMYCQGMWGGIHCGFNSDMGFL